MVIWIIVEAQYKFCSFVNLTLYNNFAEVHFYKILYHYFDIVGFGWEAWGCSLFCVC
jgi:hypothetical protein